jgi:hypothetical protein
LLLLLHYKTTPHPKQVDFDRALAAAQPSRALRTGPAYQAHAANANATAGASATKSSADAGTLLYEAAIELGPVHSTTEAAGSSGATSPPLSPQVRI